MIRIILVNIILLAIIILGVDFYAFQIVYRGKINKPKLFKYEHYLGFKNLTKEFIYGSSFRKSENISSDKNPIVIFGCSYAYGHNLNENETFSHRLAQQTGRPVYNRAQGGMGPQFMLYQLRNEEFYNIVPKPEYVIYVLIASHMQRIIYGQTYAKQRWLFYKEQKDNNKKKLVRNYLKEIFYRNYLLFYINDKYNYKRLVAHPKQNELDFLKLHLAEAKREVEQHWGKDVKFIIVFYDRKKYIERYKSIIPDLENAGIEIIDINKLSNIDFNTAEYQLSDKDSHPNAKAWEVLTPLLVKKIGL